MADYIGIPVHLIPQAEVDALRRSSVATGAAGDRVFRITTNLTDQGTDVFYEFPDQGVVFRVNLQEIFESVLRSYFLQEGVEPRDETLSAEEAETVEEVEVTE